MGRPEMSAHFFVLLLKHSIHEEVTPILFVDAYIKTVLRSAAIWMLSYELEK